MSKRVLLAGLFHETHTFLEGLTPLEAFDVRRGDELLAALDDGSPLGGVLMAAREHGWSVIPTIDLRATPSATVSDQVFELCWEEFQRIATKELAAGIDGIYFVLHGAMVCESLPDVEGEFLERTRRLAGAADVPLCGVLDLHCNFTQRMARYSDALVAYQKNPHTDSEAAAMKAARLLEHLMQTGQRARTVFAQPPIVWPPTGVGTDDDPMKTLEQMAREIEAAHQDIAAVNVFAGFSFADTQDTGASFSAVTLGREQPACTQLAPLSQWAMDNKELGNVIDPPIESVMEQVLAHDGGPVLLVEPSDNIGGGAPGDGTGVLKTLLKHQVENAAVVMNDPQAVARCGEIQIGERAVLNIGAAQSRLSSGPAEIEVELLSRSDGRFDLEDRNSHLASMRGVHIKMGPCAVVRCGGVRILLTSLATPPFDLGQLRSQGIVPEELAVIGVKAAVAHRRAYDPIQIASYTIDTPGPCSSNLKSFPYEKIRRPIFPLDDL